MPSIFIAKDGSISVSVNVLVLKESRDAARERGISLSHVLNEALKKKLQERGEEE